MNATAQDLNIELETYSADSNRFLMKQQFISVINRNDKVDAVIFNNYKDSASQFIKLANDAKVFSFLVNSAMTDQKNREMGEPRDKFPYWIGQMHPDEAGANKRIVNRLIDEATRVLNKQKINVIGINGPISSGAAVMRLNALTETLAENTQTSLRQVVNVEGWNEIEASAKFQALMKRYADTDVVWAGSARLVDGILDGEKSLPVKAGVDYFTGGVGFKRSMLEAIKNDQVSIAAGGHYIEGVWALILVFDYLSGNDFVEHGVELSTPMGIVTKANVDLYLDNLTQQKWTPDNLNKINFKHYTKTFNLDLVEYDFDFDSIILQLY
jgi:ABC-type sugar transport system substrate-binding protein